MPLAPAYLPTFPVIVPLLGAAALLATLTPLHAFGQAGDGDRLLQLLNEYRMAPGECAGRPVAPAPALAAHAALIRADVTPGRFLDQALEHAGYLAEQVQAIELRGPEDAAAAMLALRTSHCRMLLGAQFQHAGVQREGERWLVLLAREAAPRWHASQRSWADAGREVLAATNAARAQARRCGERQFPAAPPLAWSTTLGQAAQAHSSDMSEQRYFSHRGKDGSGAGERVQRAGYRARKVGENIASGQESPQEAVEGWLSSPGHCANLMNPDFTEMGAAYAVRTDRRNAIFYWTQVFGLPR